MRGEEYVRLPSGRRQSWVQYRKGQTAWRNHVPEGEVERFQKTRTGRAVCARQSSGKSQPGSLMGLGACVGIRPMSHGEVKSLTCPK